MENKVEGACLGLSGTGWTPSKKESKLKEITEFSPSENKIQTGSQSGLGSKVSDSEHYSMVIKVSPHQGGVFSEISPYKSEKIIEEIKINLGEEYNNVNLYYNTKKEQIEWERIK